MAMPRAMAIAAAVVICASVCNAPARTTPTPMPSGRLCIVTASDSIAVRDRRLRGPSGLALPMWRWGVRRSISSRKAMPARKPAAAGTTDSLPMSAAMSMPGISNDHTEAATMTPEAKPRSDF